MKLFGNRLLHIGLDHVLADFHGYGSDAARASFVVIEQVVGFGDFLALKQLLVFRRGLPGTMRSLVVAHQEERLLFVALLQPIETDVGDNIGAIAFMLFPLATIDEHGIVLTPFALHAFPILQSPTIALPVPLYHHLVL